MDESLRLIGQPAYEYRTPGRVGLVHLKPYATDDPRSRPVRLGPNGISWVSEQGNVYVPWEDVVSVRQAVTRHTMNGKYTGTDHDYSLSLANGTTHKFFSSHMLTIAAEKYAQKLGPQPPLPPGAPIPITIGQLGQLIQRVVTARQLPKALQTIVAGQTVTFGPLVVSSQGIGNGEEGIPWDQVEDVKISSGVITVKKAGKWLAWEKVKVPEVPNVFVFIDLVNAFLKRRAATPPQPPA